MHISFIGDKFLPVSLWETFMIATQKTSQNIPSITMGKFYDKISPPKGEKFHTPPVIKFRPLRG